jgi:hypothetical protein
MQRSSSAVRRPLLLLEHVAVGAGLRVQAVRVGGVSSTLCAITELSLPAFP